MIQQEIMQNLSLVEANIASLRHMIDGDAMASDPVSTTGGTRPAIDLSPDGKIAIGRNGLEIEYRGSDNCPYGRTATNSKRPFEAVIVHHTGRTHSTDWYVQYQIDGDPSRGGHFGYHFYIAPDGHIIQGAPLTKRTNHIKPPNKIQRQDFGRHARNANAIGITCARAGWPDFRPTSAQVESLEALVYALGSHFEIPFQKTYGHGEIQSDRDPSEGQSAANRIRGWPAVSSTLVSSYFDADDDMDDGPIHAFETSSKFAHTDSIFEDADDLSVDAIRLDHAALSGMDAGPAAHGGARVLYTNQNAIRNKPCTSDLERKLAKSVEAVFGAGCTVNIYSGGQDRKGQGDRRTGSIRHDDFGDGGRAADVHVFDASGRQVKGLRLAKLGQYWLASRFGGVGHEMRGGGIHLDQWTTPPPGGGMYWTYQHSRNQSWGRNAAELLLLGHQGRFP